jgi:hypothetical protein
MSCTYGHPMSVAAAHGCVVRTTTGLLHDMGHTSWMPINQVGAFKRGTTAQQCALDTGMQSASQHSSWRPSG